MAYVVLARKWRPRSFWEMTGQEHVTKTLAQALASGKLAHAYLFHGPRGVGKTTAARILAKSVNCAQGMSPRPCDACDPCRAIQQGTSLDVVEMDGASNRGIDEIRNLREHVGYAPVQARYKVYIIDEVHMLTEPAFNALLKTLEEPPGHVIFVLATTEVHKVPATILSRCQRFEFRRISPAAMVERLRFLAEREGLGVEEEALALIARRADGSLRDAESLLDQAATACEGTVTAQDVRQLLGLIPVEELASLWGAVARQDAAAVASQLDRMVAGGMELERVATDAADLLLELIRSSLARRDTPWAPRELTERSLADFLRYLHALQQGLQAARQSARPGPLLEATFLRLALMDRTVSIERVLEALGEPVPGPSPAPRRTPSSPQETLPEAWSRLSPGTRALVEQAAASWGEGTLVLTFPEAQSVLAAKLAEPARRREVERVLHEVTGRRVALQVKTAQRDQRASPTDHPLVQEVVRRFDGAIVETRPPRKGDSRS